MEDPGWPWVSIIQVEGVSARSERDGLPPNT
jgi:hypothetical protein